VYIQTKTQLTSLVYVYNLHKIRNQLQIPKKYEDITAKSGVLFGSVMQFFIRHFNARYKMHIIEHGVFQLFYYTNYDGQYGFLWPDNFIPLTVCVSSPLVFYVSLISCT